MNRYLQLFRIGNCVMGVVGLMMGVWVAVGADAPDFWSEILIGSVVVFFFIAGGNSLNDFVDREVDREAHPERPIPSGRLSPEQVLRISGICFAVSFAMSLFLDPTSTLVVLIAIALMLLYEAKTKKAGLSGNINIALLTSMLFLLGGTIVGGLERTFILAALAGLATLGREIIKDVEDMESDFDRLTLPKRVGKKRAHMVAAVPIIVAVVLSLWPYLDGTFSIWYLAVVLVADAIFIYAAVVQFRNPRQGQKFAKYGMMVALVAFLLGGFQ